MSEQERLQEMKAGLASPDSAMHGIIDRKIRRYYKDAEPAAQPAPMDSLEYARQRISALEAERDALREALQGLVADYDWSAGGKNIYAKEHPVTIARAALGAAQKAHEPA